MTLNYKRTKLACYSAYFTMACIFCVPPLLFVTLREMYDISYTLLGTLVLVNFCTQLLIDLVFTFFSRFFNIKLTLRLMPILTSLGLFIYAAIPMFFPGVAYLGLVIGTVIFSVSAGLSEVLLSPTIAAIPSDNPQKDMSALHSLYAFGFFTMVVISTLFLRIFGNHNWMYLICFMAVLQLIPTVLFMTSPIPEMNQGGDVKTKKGSNKFLGLALCVACIFCGSCAENTMSAWISGFMENALKIDKTVGDILGMAMFAILLGFTRMGYAKFGKNIFRMLLVGMVGSVACYFAIGLSGNVIVAFVACILTGVFSSMLWPGTLIMMEENIPGVGVAAYALMAASGDFGASLAPQLMGIVVDKVAASEFAANLSGTLALSAEQIGMRAGMLVNSVFPILGTLFLILAIGYFKKKSVNN